jgi:UDP-N-acetylmuramyl pentapeptide phosphotransferase/UDP-N-acetylglucosamine-1-phosphate transferase
MIALMFYSAIFLLSFALTFFVRKWAIRKAIIDLPNNRSSHSIPTPRGGGLAVAVTWFIGIIFLFIFGKIELHFFIALLCGFPLSLIGFFDDILNLRPSVRFLVQFASAAAGLFFLGGLQKFDLGFFVINNYWILSIPALIGILWAINLFNFLDGIDGYISAEIIFIFGTIAIWHSDISAALLVFAVLGFLIWNWQPAKIFMGDVGSTLLGYNVALFAIYYQNTNQTSIIIWLILSSVFWFDATITLYRRWRNKENLSEAHRKHAYQRLVQSGFSHQKTVLFAFAINIIFTGLILTTIYNKVFLLPVLTLCLVILTIAIRLIDKRKKFA